MLEVKGGAWAEEGLHLGRLGLRWGGDGGEGSVLACCALPRWDKDVDRSTGWWSLALSYGGTVCFACLLGFREEKGRGNDV